MIDSLFHGLISPTVGHDKGGHVETAEQIFGYGVRQEEARGASTKRRLAETNRNMQTKRSGVCCCASLPV